MSIKSTTPEVGFVACIERGVLETQALLLFESIRRYAGCFSGCPIYALSPRQGHNISNNTRAKLDRWEQLTLTPFSVPNVRNMVLPIESLPPLMLKKSIPTNCW